MYCARLWASRVPATPGGARRIAARAVRAALITALVVTLQPTFPPHAQAAPWTVDTSQRTEADIRAVWSTMRPTYSGSPYAVAPSIVAPHTPGEAAAGFIQDGLNTINFARYLAGLPHDVTTTPVLNSDAQHGAVLLAASTFSHTPPRPANMLPAFYDIGRASTLSSNIGRGFNTSVAFQMACLADEDTTNIVNVGHRRWLLNPPMRQTSIGVASRNHTTYAHDRSRVGTVNYDTIAWPAEGLFPVEFFDAQIPWSITLNPARYDWDQTGHQVRLQRVSDGRTWRFNAGDTDRSGEYFNAEFGGFGVANAFIFRPNPASVAYRPGDEFIVTLSGGGIRYRRTGTPATVTYRTRFMTLDAPVEPPVGVRSVSVAGSNRIETAIAASQLAFPTSTGADTVVIATASAWPDALGGAALAGALDAPILLTTPSALPAAAALEITRLGASRAVILGGTGAVSAAVERALETQLGGASRVDRIAGSDRYDTARKVAAETVARLRATPGGYSGTAFVATGANYPDALAASALAVAKGWPIFLVNPAGLDAQTVSAMRSAGVSRALVLGGTAAIPESIRTSIWSRVGCATRRLTGQNRYATAVAVASFGVSEAGLSWNNVALATGEGFADALAGGVLQGRSGSVVLLTPSGSLHSSVRTVLTSNRQTITEVRFLGGTGVLTQRVRNSTYDALR